LFDERAALQYTFISLCKTAKEKGPDVALALKLSYQGSYRIKEEWNE